MASEGTLRRNAYAKRNSTPYSFHSGRYVDNMTSFSTSRLSTRAAKNCKVAHTDTQCSSLCSHNGALARNVDTLVMEAFAFTSAGCPKT